jgi:hypothetical protein
MYYKLGGGCIVVIQLIKMWLRKREYFQDIYGFPFPENQEELEVIRFDIKEKICLDGKKIISMKKKATEISERGASLEVLACIFALVDAGEKKFKASLMLACWAGFQQDFFKEILEEIKTT